MIIYLSGPMSGIPEYNFPAFNAAAARLREMGYGVINPAEIEQPDIAWGVCMRNDITELMRADTVALLPGWENSAGSGLEITIALALGMDILDAHTLEPIGLDVNVDIKSKYSQPRGEGPR